MFNQSRRPRRKTDPFLILLLFVTLGMSVTLAYQIQVYQGAAGKPPIARQTPSSGPFGG